MEKGHFNALLGTEAETSSEQLIEELVVKVRSGWHGSDERAAILSRMSAPRSVRQEEDAREVARIAASLVAPTWAEATFPFKWEHAITDAAGCLAAARKHILGDAP